MPYTVVLHIANEDPVCGELEQLPSGADTCVTVHHPRRRDGKDVHYLAGDVVTVIWPINQITFIEVMPSEGDEHVISFVRD